MIVTQVVLALHTWMGRKKLRLAAMRGQDMLLEKAQPQ